MPPITFRAKGWLEKDGRVVAGAGRIRLLTLIHERGSISAAAREMGMSYRHAWGLVKEMEAVLGSELVESVRGGKIGGRSRLTDAGKALLEQYRSGERSLKRAGLS